MQNFIYDPLGEGESFHIRQFNRHNLKLGNTSPAHLSYTLCTRGEIKFKLNNDDDTVYTLNKYSWFWIRPYDVINVISFSPDVQIFDLTLNYKLYLSTTDGLELNQFFLDDESKRFVRMSKDQFRHLLSFINYYKAIINRLDAYEDKERVMGNCLCSTSLLYSLSNASTPGQNRKGQKIIEQFIRLVNKNFREEHQLSFYSERLMITSNRLFVLCNEHIGMAPKKLIEFKLLSHLKAELRETQYKLADLVELYHFPDLSYMSRYVKKETGLSPMEYRKRYSFKQ
ncbi:MAG: helix-turn-helix domain-containing protein [Bacteroidaceae bacterium]|nr:helix-turn-helix domain-containing protein [Bacteroidaceae bacterium]